jgi:TetR/AcrR family transcriptional regulator, transcriptional repressor for nem operon
VTEAAGMTLGSLYSQFGSKERLVEEALDYVMAASAQNMDGAATLADYVAGYLTASHRDMPGRGCSRLCAVRCRAKAAVCESDSRTDCGGRSGSWAVEWAPR